MPRFSMIFGRAAAVLFVTATGTAGLWAQQSAGSASTPVSLKTQLMAPVSLTTPSELNYSSSTGVEETAKAEDFDLGLGAGAGSGQSSRPYHRPNYHDSRTNSDGSAKWTFEVGGGFNNPVGGTRDYLSTGWRLQAGGGRNFNKTFGLLVQFDYDDFGFTTSTLNNQLALYNSLCPPDESGQCSLSQLGGNTHDWSFTLNPIMNFYTSDTWGAYAVVGAGFYHKTANFTTPGTGIYCDPFYGCYTYEADQVVDKYVSNAFGINGGLGLTYKFSRFSSTKFFAEVRYVWTDNSKRPFDVSGTTDYFNAFPQNSNPTSWIPVTFGVRF